MYLIGLRKKKSDAKQELKEKRYTAILLLCYAFVNYEREHTTLVINRPNLNSKEELLNELTAEWVNMSLYASDEVILKMKELLEKQTRDSYSSLILEMRKNLYWKCYISLDSELRFFSLGKERFSKGKVALGHRTYKIVVIQV